MASISVILGIIGNVIAILMFASPMKTLKQVVKKKSTEDFKGLPYIMTLLSTSLWIYYGLLKPGALLIVTVNGAGAGLHIVYVFLFIFYAPKKVRATSLKLVGALDIGFLGAVVLVTILGFKEPIRITIVGFICAGLTIGMYAAPLSAMRMVIKTKSVKYMPFFLSFFQFLNGAIWSAYAVVVRDYFIGVPNAVGLLLGSVQLILYIIYNRQLVSSQLEETTLEDGSPHISNNNNGIHMQMKVFENTNKDGKTTLCNQNNTSGGITNSLPAARSSVV